MAYEIQSFLFKFMLTTHFTASSNSNVDREDLFQYVIAVILTFVVKDHNGISVCLIKILLTYTVSVLSFTVALYTYGEFSFNVFKCLHKFYSILTFKFLCHRNILMLHYSILFFIFSLMVMVFMILLTC